jgi:hypothetical protein
MSQRAPLHCGFLTNHLGFELHANEFFAYNFSHAFSRPIRKSFLKETSRDHGSIFVHQ